MRRPNHLAKEELSERHIRRCPSCFIEVNSAEKVCHLCGACLCISPDPKSNDRATTCKKCGGKIVRKWVDK